MPTFSAKRIIVPALFLILIGFLPSLVWLYSTYFAPKFGGWPAKFTELPIVAAFGDLWLSVYLKLPVLRYVGFVLLGAGIIWALVRQGLGSSADGKPGHLLASQVLFDEVREINGKEPDKALTDSLDEFRREFFKLDDPANKDKQPDPDNVNRPVYQWLNGLDRTALCISGGGIRSASFALGVLQALAAHPRSAGTQQPVKQPTNSLLSQFQYLSTVSGGGYIGSWLSTWIRRQGFPRVHADLVRAPDRMADPGEEPLPIGWLREHSNYLTPKTGITSPDTLTGVAIFARNLVLNWLVLVPILIAGLIVMKLLALLVFVLYENNGPKLFLASATIGFILLFSYLRFILRNRPTRNTDTDTRASSGTVMRRALLPAIAAAFAFTLCMALAAATKNGSVYGGWLSDLMQLDEGKLALTTLVPIGAVCGAILYAVVWITSWPKVRGTDDFWRWTVSGIVYGVLVAHIVHFFAKDAIGDWIFFTAGEWLNQVFHWIGHLFTKDAAQGARTGADAAQSAVNATAGSPTAGFKHVLVLVHLGVPLLLGAQLIAEMIFVGLTSYQKNSDDDREWLGRAAGLMLLTALGWLVVMYLIYVGGDITYKLINEPFETFLLFAALYITGFMSAAGGKSGRTPVQPQQPESVKAKSANSMLAMVAIISIVLLIVITSAVIDLAALGHALTKSDAELPVGKRNLLADMISLAWILCVAAFVGVVASKSINVNRFSMHALYRNRLVRTFLGASNQDRKADSFTDFARDDNPRMHDLWGKENKLNPHLPANAQIWQPFHIINIALNITSSAKNLRWQERKAASFTVSPLHSGSAVTGYRGSEKYGGDDGISVGTAVAISGAAASPNQGYNSSPPVAFLMGLFNVRLGWWLGNPGLEGEVTHRHDGPKTAARPLLAEILGLTDDDAPYVYLSDGGHFENLALYEMVRRRCRWIVVSDAGCDPYYGFADIGNAVRKIEIDLGVPIRFRGLDKLRPRSRDGKDVGPGHPCHAIGEIDYPAADGGGEKGTILYIKPGYHGTETAAGIRSYAISNADFPHDSTANQWFGESQLESYRSLGFEITDTLMRSAIAQYMKTATDTAAIPTLKDLITALQDMQFEYAASASASSSRSI